jgi:hypothetical protein
MACRVETMHKRAVAARKIQNGVTQGEEMGESFPKPRICARAIYGYVVNLLGRASNRLEKQVAGIIGTE